MNGDIRLKHADLRMLRRFITVVEAGGITAASQQLGITQSTLSSQLASLERTLGTRLCRRGRGGFRLTREGEVIYRSAERLLGAVDAFGNDVAALRGELTGVLHIGTVDNIASNRDCRLPDAIAEFRRVAPNVQISLRVSTPEELETGVLEAKYGLALVPLRKEGRALLYDHLFDEPQALYCGRQHPLAEEAGEIEPAMLTEFAYAGRGYFQDQTIPLKPATVAWDMESILLLVLSGHFIGHLPRHYAETWLSSGEISEVRGPGLRYASPFYAVRRGGHHADPMIDRFRQALVAVHAAPMG
ncbi:LysR family transcriptional regulator [Paralimibaculum aggregatum]|uniref:LysR family transcriptional regulator n=1 Tax=Paralimibaculum aggregatum TaxID=3036245 RepID=A0ABQ6LSH3_9RHOB|nr:LysR family transcriptional regulator [Limibaculum sp. NKW23]GMG85028.1 LysR family transcriptional regulator [Limibaculum sp. NKW23]